jgi:hypothetical protein
MAAITGKWYAASNEHDGYPAPPDAVRFVYATQPDGERYIVAKVWSGDDGDYEGTARLVAAAPELMAALKAHLPWQEEPKQGWGAWQDVVDAIAKAEGRG